MPTRPVINSYAQLTRTDMSSDWSGLSSSLSSSLYVLFYLLEPTGYRLSGQLASKLKALIKAAHTGFRHDD